MDLETMQDRVYDGLRDAPREFILVDEVTAWLNEAQQDLAMRLKLTQKEQAGTVATDGTVSLPADFIAAKVLRLGDADEAQWVDDNDWYRYKDENDPTLSGAPVARVFDNKIEIFPAYSPGVSYKLRYYFDPYPLVAPTDVPNFPAHLHIKMVYYARSQGFLRLNELTHAQAFMELYERGLPPPPLGKDQIFPGPIRLRYEPGPFDTACAKHRG